MFANLTEYQTKRCISILEKRAKSNKEVQNLIEFISDKFKVEAISAFYGVDKNGSWLKIVFRFDKDIEKISGKNLIKNYIIRSPLYDKLNKIRNFYMSLESFETQIRTNLIQKILLELNKNQKELLESMNIWFIAAISDVPVVFYFTKQDAVQGATNGNHEKMEKAIKDFVIQSDESKYLTHTKIKVFFDSKEILDSEYNGNLYYYFK